MGDDCLEGISSARGVGGINSSVAPIKRGESYAASSEPRPVLRGCGGSTVDEAIVLE